MPRIHPTAVIHPNARLADSVEVGAYSVVEKDVEIGEGSVLRPHALVRRFTTMGKRNYVDSFCALGGDPQDHKFTPETRSFLRIGDGNVFREGVTISRATGEDNATIVGNETYWMTCSHAGHNALINDHTILTNGAVLGGHTQVGRGAILSAHVAVHQFCWIGEMAMLQGNASCSMHMPPYVIAALPINNVVGLNVVGLRRAEHISDEDRKQIKEAFALVYRRSLSPSVALEQMDACSDWGEPAQKFREFVRRVLNAEGRDKRGLCPMRERFATS
jgi:UDP-N-acetylglucosamine acyltransferase